MSIWLGTSFMGMNGFPQLYVNGGVGARARGVFAGGFEKFRCFNVVFLWFVCGERLVKAGSLTVTFSWSKIFHFFQLYFEDWCALWPDPLTVVGTTRDYLA